MEKRKGVPTLSALAKMKMTLVDQSLDEGIALIVTVMGFEIGFSYIFNEKTFKNS